MAQRANTFIPDVSGSTELLIKTAPDHSSHIINELLSVLFESNNSDLTLLEIKGEALLFFRKGEAGAGSSVGDLKKYCGGRIYVQVANWIVSNHSLYAVVRPESRNCFLHPAICCSFTDQGI